MLHESAPKGTSRGGKFLIAASFFAGLGLGLVLMGGGGQQLEVQDPALMMAATGATNLRVPTKGLVKQMKMESMKTGIPMKEVNGMVLRCQQTLGKVVGKSVVMGGLLKGCEALALVDERLAGEGTGLSFGVNDPSLGFAIGGSVLFIFIAWLSAQDQLGPDEGRGY